MLGIFEAFVATLLLGQNPYDRMLTGPAAPLGQVAVDVERLRRDGAYQREIAWEIAARVGAPLNVSDLKSVPRFMSWYSVPELSRLTAGVLETGAVTETVLSDDVAYLAETLEGATPSFADWKKSKLAAWMAESTDTQAKVFSVPGLSRTLFGPELTVSILKNAKEIHDCVESGLPEAEAKKLCFKDMPAAAVAVKAAWMPVAGLKKNPTKEGIPVYHTDKQAIDRLFEGEGEWVPSSFSKNPDGAARAIRDGKEYALVGLHIMMRLTEDWFWVTLWWSPESQNDFGADRPKDWAMATGASGYKMCSVASFEGEGGDGRSWCSNPYLEEGRHNATTNCIGCHQHAGSGMSVESILDQGIKNNRRERATFPTEYLWSFYQAEPRGFGPMIHELVSQERQK